MSVVAKDNVSFNRPRDYSCSSQLLLNTVRSSNDCLFSPDYPDLIKSYLFFRSLGNRSCFRIGRNVGSGNV
jgi:hypothetical protein